MLASIEIHRRTNIQVRRSKRPKELGIGLASREYHKCSSLSLFLVSLFSKYLRSVFSFSPAEGTMRSSRPSSFSTASQRSHTKKLLSWVLKSFMIMCFKYQLAPFAPLPLLSCHTRIHANFPNGLEKHKVILMYKFLELKNNQTYFSVEIIKVSTPPRRNVFLFVSRSSMSCEQ